MAVACLAPLCLQMALLVLLFSWNLWWLKKHPEVAQLHHCVVAIERLDATDSPSRRGGGQQRRAMEVYVAGRFRATITDPSVWSHTFTESLFTANQRKIAERAVEAHSNPTDEQVADAAAQLRPFLDKMSEGLPGFPVGTDQILVYALAMALSHLIMLLALPSVLCAVLFRRGLLMYVFGIAVVTRDGTPASRLRTFGRSLVTWSPSILLLVLGILLIAAGLAPAWSVGLVALLAIGLAAWSAWLPDRGLPDRIAGTYLAPWQDDGSRPNKSRGLRAGRESLGSAGAGIGKCKRQIAECKVKSAN